MPTYGWRSCGAAIRIPKEHVCGLITPPKNNSFCRFTQLTVLRLLTTEKIMGRDTQSMAQAWNLWDHVWADDRIAFLPEPENIEKEFRSRSRLASQSPKVWADAYLLAFASVVGLKLVTLDRALKADGTEVLVL